MPTKQDLFICHADADKDHYVLPLTAALKHREVGFWLDTLQIEWQDNLVMKINDGIRKSRFALLCLSKNFLSRPWVETEMSAFLAVQNTDRSKNVLPLILNSKKKIFRTYPILAGFPYKEFKVGVQAIADEIQSLVGQKGKRTTEPFHVILESVHSEKLSNLYVPRRTSMKWLAEKARRSAGVKDHVNIGSVEKYPIRWVLVDVRAEEEWDRLPAADVVKMKAVVKSSTGLKASYSYEDRLEDIGVYDGITFHLYAIPEVKLDPEHERRSHALPRGGGGWSGNRFKFASVRWRRPPTEEEERAFYGEWFP